MRSQVFCDVTTCWLVNTGWSKSLCAPDDYNTESYKYCPPPVSRHLLTRWTVLSKTVFSIARSTFRMYSVTAIFNSSVVWGLFEYPEFFIAPQRKKSGREISGDLGGQMVLEMIPSANASSKSAIDIVVGDWNCLKCCVFECFCTVIVRCTETFSSLCSNRLSEKHNLSIFTIHSPR